MTHQKRTRALTRIATLITLLVLISLMLRPSGVPVAAGSGARDYTIRLKSRKFTPPAGLTPQERMLLATQATDAAVGGRLHVLLQFKEHPGPEERAQLARQGVRLLTYLPEYAWYASVPARMALAGELPSGARWMGAVRPEDKIAPVLKRHLPPDAPLRLYLLVYPDVTMEAAKQALKALGGTVLNAAPEFGRLHVEMPGPEALPKLAVSDLWYWITREPPPKRRLNDGSRAATRTDPVHTLGYHGNPSAAPGSIVLAIWDGGWVATTHAAFSGRLTIGDPNAPNGQTDLHGTHVAGTMAGSGAASPAGRDLRGHADGARIISYDWDDSDTEHRPAIRDFDIDISQNSWGMGDVCADFGVYDHSMLGPEYDAIVNGVYGKRVSVVFAAGNQQADCPPGWDTIGAPATAKNVIAVGATNSDDKSMTWFSSWGPVDDGRLKPDVVAPGCEKGGEGAIWSTLPPNTYGGPDWCGTSMAAPAVSGILGLFLEAYNQTYGNDPWPSTLKAVLIHTAEDLGNPGPDYQFGYGHVDALAGINLITATANDGTSRYIRQDSVVNGGAKTYTLNSDGSSPLKCTLVWDDKEGTSSSSKALINDLDLRMIAPDGTTYYPWVLDKRNPGRAATRGDNRLDNVEQVVVDTPQAGQWTVQVIGDSVPQGPEEFSLVCPFGAPAGPTLTPTGPTPTLTPTTTPTATTTPTPTPTATPTGQVCNQVLGNPGFEDDPFDPSPWVTSGDVFLLTGDPVFPAHGGQQFASLLGAPDSQGALYQTVDLPTGANAITLRFWWRVAAGFQTVRSLQGNSSLQVQVRDGSGNLLQTLVTLDENGPASWAEVGPFDLGAYAGQQVRVHFQGANNAQGSAWFDVDDVALEVCTGGTPPTPCTLPADVDGNDRVELRDIQLIAGAWRSDPPDLRYDVDKDGDVDVVDVMQAVVALGDACR